MTKRQQTKRYMRALRKRGYTSKEWARICRKFLAVK